ncbi:permease prefix domain 1-containing protein [Vallitalea guaymasensis]|uniref:FtsW/RodA/SpoVE family cell cycle protein n=1 Tax=Vallitalea guaymasensis TaxID=1185412 RepID=A0A8J8M7E4_9FIRM|nr:permease prefix domain 1-containing protein [Vallitalea guaymasensis]QUH27510.1 FtsW/RodA/SpoVE family cell cycle protein [Vallitalea guaymasensis]
MVNQYNETLEKYLDIVCKQIKSKCMHTKIRKELLDHLNDQIDAYIEKGITKEQASEMAIKEMGNPLEIGNQLNNTHKPLISHSTIIIILMFIAVGGWIQYLFSYSLYSIEIHLPTSMNFIKYSLAGILFFIATYYFDYTWLKKHPIICYMTFIILITIINVTTSESMGGKYLAIYPFLLFVPVYASVVYSLRNTKFIGVIVAIIAFIPAIIISKIISFDYPYIIVLFSCLALLTCAILKGYFNCNKIIKISTIIIISIIFLVVICNLFTKVITLTKEIEEIDGKGFETYVIKESIVNAKPFGETMINYDSSLQPIDSMVGNWSRYKTLIYINSKYGYVPALVITTLLLSLVYKLIRIHKKQQNHFGTLLSLGCVSVISLQIIISIFYNIGLNICRISPFPLISYGADNFIVNMMLLGLILSIYRRSNIIDDKLYNDSSYIYYKNGKLIFDLKYYKNL